MKSQVLSHFPMPWLTCVALLIFVSVFALILLRVFRRSNAALYRQLECMPLFEEGDRHE